MTDQLSKLERVISKLKNYIQNYIPLLITKFSRILESNLC